MHCSQKLGDHITSLFTEVTSVSPQVDSLVSAAPLAAPATPFARSLINGTSGASTAPPVGEGSSVEDVSPLFSQTIQHYGGLPKVLRKVKSPIAKEIDPILLQCMKQLAPSFQAQKTYDGKPVRPKQRAMLLVDAIINKHPTVYQNNLQHLIRTHCVSLLTYVLLCLR